jgi:hypothetical protein
MEVAKAFTCQVTRAGDQGVIASIHISYNSGLSDTITIEGTEAWKFMVSARYLFYHMRSLPQREESTSGYRCFLAAIDWTEEEAWFCAPLQNGLIRVTFYGDLSGSFTIHRVAATREGLQCLALALLRQLRRLERNICK